MKKLFIWLMIFVVSVAFAVQYNLPYTLLDANHSVPLGLICDTTQAVNDTVHTTSVTGGVPLFTMYQFIIQIDSTASQSTTATKKASDSSWYRIKVQSRFGHLPNAFWSDICSVTTGSTGADTGTWVIEKVLFLAADTTQQANFIGDEFRVVVTMQDSMTSPISANTLKIDRLYGSVQVAGRY